VLRVCVRGHHRHCGGKTRGGVRTEPRASCLDCPLLSVCARLVRNGPGHCSRDVLSPALGNYTLFALPLAGGTVLGSLVPLFLVPMPIRWLQERERPFWKGVLAPVMVSRDSALLVLTPH